MGTLYSVALPIGHALDMSWRAKEILEKVEIIACEDSRKARDWFRRIGVKPTGQLLAYHSYNEHMLAPQIVEKLRQGKNVALIADAGTPRLCDPGYVLLKLCWENKLPVKPVPGPSALTALLSVAPMPVFPLLFLGFLPSKSAARKNQLSQYQNFVGTIALYESRHRLQEMLADLREILGESPVFIGRELTKDHEEFFWGSLGEAITWSVGKRGEFVMLLDRHNKIGKVLNLA
ncbi:MAG: 16S rRNA (cytidine(1402)-2'-O)-methyltransferase [Leptospiraceae bacterium]|nr:16S rRNA (cytidine(1402)-2'-O)-methyltransferase [Leptospiraceae bacterium]